MPNATPTPAPAPARVLEVRRLFAAPRDRVFAAWTSAEALKRWYAPADAVVDDAGVDFRVGGRYHVRMRGTDGSLHLVEGAYRDPLRRALETKPMRGLFRSLLDDDR